MSKHSKAERQLEQMKEERDYWRKVAADRDATNQALAVENATLRTDLETNLRMTRGAVGGAIGGIDKEMRELVDELNRLRPAAEQRDRMTQALQDIHTIWTYALTEHQPMQQKQQQDMMVEALSKRPELDADIGYLINLCKRVSHYFKSLFPHTVDNNFAMARNPQSTPDGRDAIDIWVDPDVYIRELAIIASQVGSLNVVNYISELALRNLGLPHDPALTNPALAASFILKVSEQEPPLAEDLAQFLSDDVLPALNLPEAPKHIQTLISGLNSPYTELRGKTGRRIRGWRRALEEKQKVQVTLVKRDELTDGE